MTAPGKRIPVWTAGMAASALTSSLFAQPQIIDLTSAIARPNPFGGAPSADGEVEVLSADQGNEHHAFRLSQAHGMEDLSLDMDPSLGGLGYYFAWSVSDDGSVVAGTAGGSFDTAMRAFRWSLAAGRAENIGDLGDPNYVTTTAVSGDGRVIIGWGNTAGGQSRAFRWDAEAGMQPIDGMSDAVAVSRDGSVIVGWQWGSPYRHAILVSPLGTEDLGLFVPTALSADGQVVIGSYDPQPPGGPVRWTRAAGLQFMAAPPPNPANSSADSLTSDGSIMAGGIYVEIGHTGNFESHASLWTSVTDLLDLNTYLPTLGIDTTGWLLEGCVITADGSTLYGSGRHNGQNASWMLRFHGPCNGIDYNHDGASGTDADIEDFFRCFAGDCCPTCYQLDLNNDGAVSTDADIEAFFAALAGRPC
jgi:probable HAF family extracellular repeat protein